MRTNLGTLPLSEAQRSPCLTSGFVLAESIVCNIHRSAAEGAGCILIPARDCLVEHACRLRRGRNEAKLSSHNALILC